MAESLPLPPEVPLPDTTALDPTEVIPRPQPVEAGEAEAVRIISGEVVGGRHRGARRPGRGSLGTAVLSATGAVAGLSLLMPHGSATTVAGEVQEPAVALPDTEVKDAAVPPAAGAAASARATDPDTDANTGSTVTTAAVTSTGTSGTATVQDAVRHTAGDSDDTKDTPRHARPNGSWDSQDWEEAVIRAASAHHHFGNGEHRGRHRTGGHQQHGDPHSPGFGTGPGQDHGTGRGFGAGERPGGQDAGKR
ncbi:hypothetical protein [Streptomyces sp. MI02-7b]|uniref:hypothetical protein n=1 Tax=Streptomyces sp. MI02-7b TaxID=462941 RepID=UPI0029AF6C85|nr:hypothetical protein [Streptomyces sp. MI02-7b]MDX3076207.1 hypothetical protein [Streptomyces sp. MI02-7b]